jgi:ribose transport system substrate-binding protein
MGVKALIIAPSDQRALMLPIARLAAGGVKIVVLDSPLAGKKWALFVGTDQEAAGEQVGRMLASIVSETDEVAVFRYNQNGSAAGQREEGALAALRAAHPKQPIHADIYSSTEPGREPDRAEYLISKYPDIRAVYASGTPGTMAMLHVLQARGLGHKIKLIGIGFNLNKDVKSAIESGDMYAWVAQLPGEAGRRSVEAAGALLKGEPVPDVIHTDVLFVTKDNVGDPKVLALMTD